MKTSELGLAIAFLAATGLIATQAIASEGYAEQNIAVGRENNAPDDRDPPVQQHRARSAPTRVAEGGSDRLIERRSVAEGGSDRLIERRSVAEGGSDRLIERRVAEGGSDRLIERRVADVGNAYNGGMDINAHFSMD